jgi:hypothetical protein
LNCEPFPQGYETTVVAIHAPGGNLAFSQTGTLRWRNGGIPPEPSRKMPPRFNGEHEMTHRIFQSILDDFVALVQEQSRDNWIGAAAAARIADGEPVENIETEALEALHARIGAELQDRDYRTYKRFPPDETPF